MTIKNARKWLGDLRGVLQFGVRSCFANSLQLLKPWQQRVYSTVLRLPSGNVKFASPTPRQLRAAVREINIRKDYYENLSKFCVKTDRSNVIDIGANIGYYTASVCYANEKIKVFSFEPDRRNLFFLALNLISNSNAVIINAGLSDSNEYKKLEIPDYALSRRGEDKFNTGLLSAEDSPASYPGTAFPNGDTIWAAYAVSPGETGWIKRDVEGYEEKVLRSLEKFINASPAVIQFEWNPNFIDNQIQVDFMVNLIKKHQMTAYIDDISRQAFEGGVFGIPLHESDIYLVKASAKVDFETVFYNLTQLPVLGVGISRDLD